MQTNQRGLGEKALCQGPSAEGREHHSDQDTVHPGAPGAAEHRPRHKTLLEHTVESHFYIIFKNVPKKKVNTFFFC